MPAFTQRASVLFRHLYKLVSREGFEPSRHASRAFSCPVGATGAMNLSVFTSSQTFLNECIGLHSQLSVRFYIPPPTQKLCVLYRRTPAPSHEGVRKLEMEAADAAEAEPGAGRLF
jgi:hypothetical protein